MLRRTAVFVLSLMLLAAPSLAVADNIDFSATGDGGTWSWNGVDPLTATFNSVSVALSGGSANLLAGSVLTVTTGAFIGGTGTLGDPFTFGAGGSIEISGCGGGAELCFSGTFTDLQLVVNAGGDTVTLTGNFIAGTVHQDILTLLGISGPQEVEGHIVVSLHGSIVCDEGNCSGRGNSASADIAVTPIPEPASLALLGTGLLGLASRFRKKLSA